MPQGAVLLPLCGGKKLPCAPMSTVKVLVIDRDEWSQKLMASLLSRRGYAVDLAKDPASARNLGGFPHLLIADVRVDAAGLAWISAWTDERSLPILFVGESPPPELKLDALRVFHADYLDKPFRFEEFDLRVDRLLRLPGVSNVGVFRGKLSESGPSSLLLLFEAEARTGVLRIERGSETCRVLIERGRLVSIERTQLGGRPEHSLAVVAELLGWSEGSFEFSACQPTCESDEGLPITPLLQSLRSRPGLPDQAAGRPGARF